MDERYASKMVEFAKEQVDPTRIANDLRMYNPSHYETFKCDITFSCKDYVTSEIDSDNPYSPCLFQLSQNTCILRENFGRVNSYKEYVNLNKDKYRFGWQELHKIFNEATDDKCNLPISEFQAVNRNPSEVDSFGKPKIKGKDGYYQKHWCGVFATWVWQNGFKKAKSNNKVWWEMAWKKDKNQLNGLAVDKWDTDILVLIRKRNGKWSIQKFENNHLSSKTINKIREFIKGPGVGDMGVRSTENIGGVPEHVFIITDILSSTGNVSSTDILSSSDNVSSGTFFSIDGNSTHMGIIRQTGKDKGGIKISEIEYYYTVINLHFESGKKREAMIDKIEEILVPRYDGYNRSKLESISDEKLEESYNRLIENLEDINEDWVDKNKNWLDKLFDYNDVTETDGLSQRLIAETDELSQGLFPETDKLK